jgi:predicted aspartyl protease
MVLLAGSETSFATTFSMCDAVRDPRRSFAMQIPFEIVDGRLYVKAAVNGHGPFRFAVDTGASGLGRIDASLISSLGLKIRKSIANSDGIKSSEADTTRIDSLDIGGLSRRNFDAITRDYNSKMAPEARFSGIVAREFFGDGLLIIDYPRKMLSFSKSLSLSPGQDGVVVYERPFRIPVSIGGVHVEGNLDTGANVTFVLPQRLFEKVSDATLRLAGRGQLTNSQMETKRAVVHGPFLMARASLSDVEVRVSEQYPELLVGAYALQSLVVLIDQRSKSIAFCH